MSTQTGSISFESTKSIHNYAKQNFSTLSQVLGQFATCGTGASTTAKVATIVPENSNWTLQEGTTVTVTFSSANTTTTPTLNVNGTGAKQIRDSEGNELTKAAREWVEGAAIAFTYDGTYWRIQDSNLMERVHTAETEINQTANNVLIKATENDTTAAQGGQHLIESFINVAPSGVTISADKVNIEGATIFTGNGRLSQTSLNNVYATKDDLEEVSSGAELTKSMSGERTIITEDAADLPLLTLDPVYGESMQNGTPTPDAPIYIQALKSPHRFPGGDTLEVTIPGRSEDNKEIWGNYSGSATRTLRSDGTYERTYTGIYNGIGITFYGKTSLSVGDEFYVSCSFRNDSSVNISIAIYCMELDSSGTRVYTGLLVNGTGASAGWGTVEAGTEKRFTMKCVWTQSCQDLLNNGGCIRLTIQKTSSGNDPITMFHPMINIGSSVQDWTPEGHLGIISKSGDNQVLDITYLNLKGNEFHGLDETYRDIFRIDANGHATIEKRTELAGPDIFTVYSTPSDGTRFRSIQPLAEPPATNNTTPIIKSNMHVPLHFSGSFISGKCGIVTRGRTDYGGAGTLFIGMPTSITTNQQLLDNYPNLKILYPLPESDWYTIDLGYIDLPQVTDGSTVYVAAEIQPVIGGSWWTKAGESVGQLAQQNKSSQGTLEAPYSEVEWVESNGKQYVYLDWKPKIATWGFEADFIIYNAFNTTQAEWNASTNKNNAGAFFGVRNAYHVNDCTITSYSTNGELVIGNASVTTSSTFKKDKTRQSVKLHGTTLTHSNGITTTVTRSSETAGKLYGNMTVFAFHDGLRKTGSGSVVYPGTVRVYSLKFYDSDTLECDLVGAIRKKDGVTGLYDKIAGKFYPAPGMTYGEIKNDLGKPQDVFSSIKALSPQLSAYNDTNTRMLNVNAPMLDKLEDGQVINLTYLYAIGASYQTTELTGWDDTGNNSYVYVKLTLSDGSTTEWIPCYYNGTSRLTTHYYAGYPLTLTYRENVFIGATATSGGYSIMRGFWVDPEYNTDTQYDKFSDSVIAGKNGIKRYTLCMKDDVGNWTSIVNQANNTAVSGKTCYTGGLQLGKILYAVSGAEYAAGASSGVMAQTYPGFDFRYSVNGVQNAAATELQLRKPIYLVGELDEDTGLFYLDTTKWWTQTEPTAENGKTYILMGSAYGSYYAAFLAAKNPTYKFINGKFQSLEDLAVQETHKIYYRTTAASNRPSAGPSTWITTATNVYNTWTTKVPPLANSTDSSTSGYTKYPFLYTCEQRRLANSTIECTDVTLDENTTIIDGGSIITNSIAANTINANSGTFDTANIPDLSAAKITSGDIAADRIQGNVISAVNNGTGTINADKINATNLHVNAANIDGTITFGQLSGVQASGDYATNTNLTTEINQRKAQYGTCNTAATTQAKVVTCANFELVAGNELTVKFSTANTYASGAVQLNVNSKGAKNVWVGNAVTSTTNKLLWGAGAYITFRYDGTQFIVIGEPRTWYGACNTAEGTAAKTDTTTVTGCVICKGTKVELAMTNANTADAPTLNIQSTGALAIYFGNGTTRPTKAGGTSWLATNTCTFTFDGATWHTQGKTYIDANNIVTGYISADRIEAGSLGADKIDVSSINIGDLAGEIGGRNLLLDTKNEKSQLYSSTALMYWGFSFTGNLPVNTYTISFDMKSSNGTDKIYFSIANNTSTIQKIADSVIPTTSYTKYSITFNYTGTSTSNGFFITSCASHGSPVNQGNSGTVYIKNVKLEKGNKATDWTPAPEDVAATATNYITRIDDNGIKVHAKTGGTNNNYAKINADGLEVFKANSSVASFGTTTRIGTASGARTELTSTGVELYNSSNQKKVSIGTGASYFYGGAGTYPYIEISNSSSGAINIKQSATSYTSITSSGMDIYAPVNSTATNVASFGTTARIGRTDSSRFLMNADSLQGYNSSNKLYFEVSSSGIKYGTDLTNSGTTYTAATTTQVSESNNAANTIVTVYPTAIDYAAGTATLAVKCMRGTTAITPSAWKWTKGTATTSIGTSSTLQVTDLNAVYNCTVTIAV